MTLKRNNPLFFIIFFFVLLSVWWCRAFVLKKQPFVVVYSNDILSELENCGCADYQLGSLARRASVLSNIRKEGKEVINVDAGNLFFSREPLNKIEREQFFIKATHIVDAFNLMDFDGVNAGDIDFVLGTGSLIELRDRAKFPIISSNILETDSGNYLFKPYISLKRAGLNIAILGVCSQKSAIDLPIQIATPLESIRKILLEISPEPDFIILLSSLGIEADRELAEALPFINLIISSKSKELRRELLIQGQTAITDAYIQGQYVGRLDVSPYRKSGGSSYGFKNQLIALGEKIADDQKILSIGERYVDEIQRMGKLEWKDETPGKDPVKGKDYYMGSGYCIECHPSEKYNWENTSHFRAFNTLKNLERHYEAQCLECHTTGYGKPVGYSIYQKQESEFLNVQCESCHGPGSRHPYIMDSVQREVPEETCIKCHDPKNSPDFVYEEYLPRVQCPGY